MSLACTLTMPSVLISKVTSISTCPFGARGGGPVRMNSPSSSFSYGALALALHDQDLHGRLNRRGWVVKTLLRLVGTVVFFAGSVLRSSCRKS